MNAAAVVAEVYGSNTKNGPPQNDDTYNKDSGFIASVGDDGAPASEARVFDGDDDEDDDEP